VADQAASPRTEYPAWHRTAVVYQVYLRSFADGDGDGIGDLAGLTYRLSYLRSLGVDAIWLNPWYVSPMADGGYDVADYRDIDPVFGSLAEAEELIRAAHAQQLKVIVDIVPNHCSDQHASFKAALAAGPGSAERARFWFRPGLGPDGSQPPNDWPSSFGGSAWTRITEADGSPGEWYLHLFAPQQPDFNWENPEVRAEFEDILRFWLDRDVDGFRIDVADCLVKDETLPDLATLPDGAGKPWEDQEGLRDIYRSWRRVIDSYPRDRVFVGEIWLKPLTRLRPFLAHDQLHTAFNFDYLGLPWDAARVREVIDTTLDSIGAAAPWVLSNHDVTRHLTRYGRADTSNTWHLDPGVPDLELGTRRARSAIMLSLALPGSVYLYQGEELGLWEVEDIPDELLADPVWERTNHLVRGRDGCRVPLPWLADAPGFGFGPTSGNAPWLPQPEQWRKLAADTQAGDPGSTLELYRTALRLRRARLATADDTLTWLEAPAGVLAFARAGGSRCMVNMSAQSVRLGRDGEVLLASAPITDRMLPPDTAVWLSVD